MTSPRRILASVLVLLTVPALPVSGPRPLRAQDSPQRAIALSAVMQFRHEWMADNTPFDVCSTFELLGRPSDFPSSLPSQVRGLLDGEPTSCAGRPAWNAASKRRALPQRVAFTDSLARVRLWIRWGEQSYVEDYVLAPHRGRAGLPWRVETMTLHGQSFEDLVALPPSQGTKP